MFLERKREAEIAQRKGTARRTILQTIWLLVVLAGAIAATEYVIFGGTEPLLNINLLSSLVPESLVPFQYREWVVKGAIALVMVLVMQVLFMIAYMFGSAEGRARSGQPTLKSRSTDPYERDW